MNFSDRTWTAESVVASEFVTCLLSPATQSTGEDGEDGRTGRGRLKANKPGGIDKSQLDVSRQRPLSKRAEGHRLEFTGILPANRIPR
ncbi:hypothetical protein J6590_040586 [Homalodisca vitripennis]|nr:hypothetical protein J6590_040586 [Homalodisca vitripennis]